VVAVIVVNGECNERQQYVITPWGRAMPSSSKRSMRRWHRLFFTISRISQDKADRHLNPAFHWNAIEARRQETPALSHCSQCGIIKQGGARGLFDLGFGDAPIRADMDSEKNDSLGSQAASN
jgi:ribosomal protein L32